MITIPTAVGPIEIIIDNSVPFGWFQFEQNQSVVRMSAANVWELYRELNPWLTASV